MRKKIYTTLAALFLVNLLLKLLFLGSNPIAWDEPFTIYHAQMDVGSIVRQLYQGNNPPLYEVMMHYWLKLSGFNTFWMRFPSAVFSSVTAVVLFQMGRKNHSFEAGLVAALLYTFSNLHLVFAHEVRVYAWFLMLTVLSMHLFMGLFRRPSFSRTAALILLNALLMYSHYFGFFVVLIQFLSVIIIAEMRKKLLLKIILMCGGVLIIFFPNLYILINRFSDSAANGTWIEKPNGIDSLYNMLWIFSNQPLNTVLCIVVLTAGLLTALLKKRFKPEHLFSKVVLLWFLFPFLFLFAISYKVPVFIDRYVAFCSFGYYLLIAILLFSFFPDKKKLGYAFSGILVVIFAVTFKPNLTNKRDVKSLVSYVREIKKEDKTLLISSHDFLLNFCYYYDRELFRNYDNHNIYERMTRKFNREEIYPLYAFDASVPLKDKVIFLDAAADYVNPDNRIYSSIEAQGYHLVKKTHFKAIYNVYEFEK